MHACKISFISVKKWMSYDVLPLIHNFYAINLGQSYHLSCATDWSIPIIFVKVPFMVNESLKWYICVGWLLHVLIFAWKKVKMSLFPEKNFLVLKFAHFSCFLHIFFQITIFKMKIKAIRRDPTMFCHFNVL